MFDTSLSSTRSSSSGVVSIIPIIILLIFWIKPALPFEIACQNDSDCIAQLQRETSMCVNGKCTNPFHSGCLRTLALQNNNDRFKSERYVRECNSDDGDIDGDDGIDESICSRGVFNYDEVRVSVGNWESSILLSWIIQILMSELLSVPVTIDTNGQGQSSFYDIDAGFAYTDIPYNLEALRGADIFDGDCVGALKKSNVDKVSCAHVLPEVWIGAMESVKQGQDEGWILPEETNGMVGMLGMFVPLHTANKDWSLTSYHGLKNNRIKLTERFGRPTSWIEYCTNIKNVNCTDDKNNVTKRYPETEAEQNSYFVEGEFIGHFEKDDCVANPDTCHGYFVNAPCHWSTYAEAQMFWNNISLKSDGPEYPNSGYSYSQMLQILDASNTTGEDLMMWWFSPDMTYTLFPLHRVHLPKPSQACLQSRPPDKCAENENERLGNFLGSCDYAEHSLNKIISKGLQTSTFQRSEVDRSPALDFLRHIKIPNMAMDDLLREWATTSSDPFTARDIVCRWVDDNIDNLSRYIPASYPRSIVNDGLYSIFLLRFAVSVGALAVLITILAGIFTIRNKNHRVLIYSHVNFLLLNLIGFGLVSITAILYTFEPTNSTCLIKEWAISIGYTLQYVPLLLKIAAINKIMQESMHLRRINFKLENLRKGVISVLIFVIIYLTVWSFVDPTSKVEYRVLSDTNKVKLSLYCSSRSIVWKFIAFTWEVVLLLCILVLALQSNAMIKEVDESQSLPLMVYTHFLFLMIRLIIAALGFTNAITSNLEDGFISLLLSGDTILCILIYFGDKFRAISSHRNSDLRNTSMNVSYSRNSSLRYSSPSNAFRGSAISVLRESIRRSSLLSHKNKEKPIERSSFNGTKKENQLLNDIKEARKSVEDMPNEEELDFLPSTPPRRNNVDAEGFDADSFDANGAHANSVHAESLGEEKEEIK